MRTGLTIRTKLLLVGMLLLLIPWMSYVYVRDMKSFLLSGQEDALSLTSRAVATVLHDRPELFSDETNIKPEQESANEIYIYPLPNYINLNGDLSDWGEQAKQAARYKPLDGKTNKQEDLIVDHLLGYHGRFIYALFSVTDDNVILRQKSILRVDAADHLRLTIQDPGQKPRYYTLIASDNGRMSVYWMDKLWQYPITGQPNYDIAAELQLTPVGYNIELRIPRFMFSSETRFKLVVADVDDSESLEIAHLLSTTPQTEGDDMSRILVQAPEIAKILQGLDRNDTRIWVLDQNKNVRAVVGNILDQSTLDQMKTKPPYPLLKWQDYWAYVAYYYNKGLQKIFSFIVDKPMQFTDHDKTVEERNDEIIDVALNGKISNDRRPSLDKHGTILMAAHPVYLGNSVSGAVVVEQSTNQVLRRQQQVLQNVISVTLLVLLTVIVALLTFASRLTLRITRLRDATDNAIDPDGRIMNQKIIPDAKSRDEIGDLSRSVSNMLGRLSQYTSYLRGLPDTLAHEVSNPLNVVNSSLHNLSQQSEEVAQSKYMQRAKNGINRIGAILRNLTEAANLEQAMQSESKESFDLVELIENYVDGYSFSHPQQPFELIIQSRPLQVYAAPDYIAQLLDKLIDNAVDFSSDSKPIIVKTSASNNYACVDVINHGSRLPENMSERIFEPLVSIGRKDAQKTRLGMGLYIVKLIAQFHGGKVSARNLESTEGVAFTFKLPIYNDVILQNKIS